MSYVVQDNTKTEACWHEVADVSDSGNYVTKCQQLIPAKQAVVGVMQSTADVTCQTCINPPEPVVAKPRKPRAPGAKPQWRTARNRHAEMIQGLQFAHKAIVAAIEWAQRGAEHQFTEQSLDQSHLGYRFLKEILIDHGRVEDDTQVEDE